MFGWYSIVAPTGTPGVILDKVSAEVIKAVKEPEFAKQLRSLGTDAVGSTRAELDAFRRSQTTKITELVKTSGVDFK
jgi:tripartite-type tricarboxylate transporter receptor subunit TctC